MSNSKPPPETLRADKGEELSNPTGDLVTTLVTAAQDLAQTPEFFGSPRVTFDTAECSIYVEYHIPDSAH